MATRKTHKARGASWESAIRDDLRDFGYDTERLARTGAKDEGDVVVKDAGPTVREYTIIEAKAPGLDGKIDLSGWLKEAVVEAENYSRARQLGGVVLPVVVIKARGKSIDEAYVVIKYKDFFKG